MGLIDLIKKYKWWIVAFIAIFFIVLFNFVVPYFISGSSKSELPILTTKVEFKMKPENMKKVVLSNGMTILIFKNDSAPKVLMQIAYDIGSWIEHAGEKGLAHLIEHMIFKGTDKLSEGDIDAIARKYGAEFNAFTSKDITSYYFESDKNNWKPFISILANCMENARFEEQHLASELHAVIQELKMYKDRYWNVMLEKACLTAYPACYAYHFPIIGFKEDLLNLSAQNLKNFYKKYYGPQRATLFVVGDINIDEVINEVKKHFEPIKGEVEDLIETESLKKEKFPPLSRTTTTYQTIIYEDVQRERAGLYWIIPGLKEKNEILVSFIEFILGQGEGSRLYRRLVDEEKIAISVEVAVDHLIESGVFFVLFQPLEGKFEECKKIIQEEIEKIIKNGVTKEELIKVINTKGREYFENLQNLQNFTYDWIQSYMATKDETEIFKRVDDFIKINSDDIQSFIKNYLDPFFVNQIQLLPLPEHKKEFWLKAKEESDLMDVKILKKYQRTTPIEHPKFVESLPDPNPLDFAFPKPDKTFELDNGLTIILHRRDQWPILNVNCRFKQASYFSEAREGILLHLMMISLMEGSMGATKQENVNFFEMTGSSYSFGVFGAAISLLNKDYSLIFEKFINVLTKPTFPKDAVEKLKKMFIDSYQRRKDSATDMAIKLLKNNIYNNHPYDWTFDQAIEILNNASYQDLKEMHKKYVSPKNMILSVVGDFDLNKIEEVVKTIFNNWNGEKIELIDYPEAEFRAKEIKHYMLRDQVVLLLGKPSKIDIYDEDLTPLKILDFISFYSLGSRLYRLREKTGLFYAAFGMFAAGASREHGFDYIGSILSLENIEKSKELLLNVIDKIGKQGVTLSELSSARQMYLNQLIDLTTSNEALSNMFARLKDYELGFDYYDKVLNVVQNITLDELNKIAAKYFISEGMTTVEVGRVK
ncbi:hypothetical protein GF322_01125 [Candidatus Dependentiae bacterium]|nr:hypothetical protein [Candidatus Dependentiae bacterium]